MSLQINNLSSYELPEEVWKYIFSFTEQPNAISCVSKVFNEIMQDSFVWATAAQSLSFYPKEFHEIASPSSFSWKKVYLEQISRNKLEQECIEDLCSYVKFVANAVIEFASCEIKGMNNSFWFYDNGLRGINSDMAWSVIELLNENNKIKDPQINYYLGLYHLYELYLDRPGDLDERKYKVSKYLETYIKEEKDPKSSSKAKYILGVWHEKNSDDLATSIGYYEDAASHNHVMAQCRFGVYYQIGKGVPIDLKKAFECYRKAADQNHPCAQYMVGRCFEFGVGTEKNLENAFAFYLTAAKQGNILAQYAVGLCYKDGKGTVCKTTEAEFYCNKIWVQCQAIHKFITCREKSFYYVKVNPLILAMGIPMPFQDVTDYCGVLGSKLENPMAEWINYMINKISYYKNAERYAYPPIVDLKIIEERIHADYGMNAVNIKPMNSQKTICGWEEMARNLSEKQEKFNQISPHDLELLHCHPNWECLFWQYQKLFIFYAEEVLFENKVEKSLESFIHSQMNLLLEDLHVFWTDSPYFSKKYQPLCEMIVLLAQLKEDSEIDKLQYYLGILHEYGIGIKKDWESALSSYKCEITNSEDAESYHHAALITQYAEEDEESAVLLYRKAADRNHVMAQCRVGFSHEESAPDEAFKWYSQAAQQNHPLAQYMMGRCLEKGMGTEINLEEAFKFYLKSAEQGHVIAQYTVSRCYEHGIGTEINKEQSKIHDEKVWMQLMNIHNFDDVPNGNTLVTNPFTEAMGAKIDVRDVIWYFRELAEADNHPVAQLIFYFCHSKQIYDLINDDNEEEDHGPITRDEAIKLLEVSAENFPLAQFVLGFELFRNEKGFTHLKEAFDRTDSPFLIEPWLEWINSFECIYPPDLREQHKELQNHLKRKYEGTEFPPSKKRRV